MRLFFHSPAFDAQLLRVASHTYFGASDLGECLTTASRIQEGDFDSWQQEWIKTADRLYIEANQAEEKGHIISARENYLRASNYYRASLFFDYKPEPPLRLLESYEKHVESFSHSARLSKHPAEALRIPFEGKTLPGYFYRVDNHAGIRPTIIVNGGYDSTHQEAYFSFVPAAIRRGYNVLSVDGPGEGELLLKEQIPIRYNWETVITPVVNYLYKRKDVDHRKISLFGPSFGGYLAARAVAFEPRISALIVHPGQYDVMDNLRNIVVSKMKDASHEIPWESFIQAAMKDKFFSAKIQQKLFIHGVSSTQELLDDWQKYSLKEIATKIRCPTLVCDAENESLAPGQAQALFDRLQCQKDFILFKASEGAGEHCSAGALGLLTHRLLDWLDSLFQGKGHNEHEFSKPDTIPLGYQK
jgi:alpha-beta hydrolase superfamily lysophospholipase